MGASSRRVVLALVLCASALAPSATRADQVAERYVQDEFWATGDNTYGHLLAQFIHVRRDGVEGIGGDAGLRASSTIFACAVVFTADQINHGCADVPATVYTVDEQLNEAILSFDVVTEPRDLLLSFSVAIRPEQAPWEDLMLIQDCDDPMGPPRGVWTGRRIFRHGAGEASFGLGGPLRMARHVNGFVRRTQLVHVGTGAASPWASGC